MELDTDTHETTDIMVRFDALLLRRLEMLETSLLRQLRGAAAVCGPESVEHRASQGSSWNPAVTDVVSNNFALADCKSGLSTYSHKASSVQAPNKEAVQLEQFERLVQLSNFSAFEHTALGSGRRGSGLSGRMTVGRNSVSSALSNLGRSSAVVEETAPSTSAALDPDVKVISAGVLENLIAVYEPGFGLENIHEALKFALGDPSEVRKMPDGQVAIDFDSFLLLKSEKVISRARRGIKRDLTLIQNALHKEMQQALYEDDGHDDWDNKLAAPEV
eukprot:TRINITY_DN29216_c0_g1_i1.p1 TRINITY_DN29216_c0_g1~~TRINITY_DN29216_c0_g1_i1.p1  ORF type:complete len:322 (+),score=44.66 TRINITY_DN29216_c0_g1_i1:142-966(+)